MSSVPASLVLSQYVERARDLVLSQYVERAHDLVLSQYVERARDSRTSAPGPAVGFLQLLPVLEPHTV